MFKAPFNSTINEEIFLLWMNYQVDISQQYFNYRLEESAGYTSVLLLKIFHMQIKIKFKRSQKKLPEL